MTREFATSVRTFKCRLLPVNKIKQLPVAQNRCHQSGNGNKFLQRIWRLTWSWNGCSAPKNGQIHEEF